ncbi:MAG: oligoribonuclease [Burkholderiales bacterium]|jgi:oligoribonuclease|nr:oligoribonuclease [Burkholderiales bacterium]
MKDSLNNRLIWIDLEMTGLSPVADRILEIAIVITDAALNPIIEAPGWVIHQEDTTLAKMDSWNQSMHKRSGLIDRVRASTLTENKVEQEVHHFLSKHAAEKMSPMCGNSICQDRRFLAFHMPRIEAFFHYRNLDVSTLKELCRRWHPQLARGFQKSSKHEALADVYESIDELKYYRDHFLRLPE